MSFSNEDIRRLARLSRLKIDEQTIESMRDNLEGIRELLQKISEQSLEDVSPLTHPGDITLRLREDIVTESDQREENLKNAPLTEDGLFLVPRVID